MPCVDRPPVRVYISTSLTGRPGRKAHRRKTGKTSASSESDKHSPKDCVSDACVRHLPILSRKAPLQPPIIQADPWTDTPTYCGTCIASLRYVPHIGGKGKKKEAIAGKFAVSPRTKVKSGKAVQTISIALSNGIYILRIELLGPTIPRTIKGYGSRYAWRTEAGARASIGADFQEGGLGDEGIGLCVPKGRLRENDFGRSYGGPGRAFRRWASGFDGRGPAR